LVKNPAIDCDFLLQGLHHLPSWEHYCPLYVPRKYKITGLVKATGSGPWHTDLRCQQTCPTC